MNNQIDVPKTRKEAEERLIIGMKNVLTKEQYEKFIKELKDIPDDVFWELVTKSLETVSKDTNTAKDYFNTVKKLQTINGVDMSNSASGGMNIKFLSDRENNILIQEISKSCSTDIVNLTRESDEELIYLWEKKGEKVTIPSDLFFAQTIPLMDVEISVDERMQGGIVVNYRVIVFDNYIKKLDSEDVEIVGAVIIPIHGITEIIIPIRILNGFDSVLNGAIGFRNMTKLQRNFASNHLSVSQIAQQMLEALETWYGLQIALLHPSVKEVFLNPQNTKRSQLNEHMNKNSKKKIKYVKKHIVNADDLKRKIHGESKSFQRKALIWYVTGHWRTYKNGSKVFINPYFKGALRETKKLSSIREREIVLGDSENGEQKI